VGWSGYGIYDGDGTQSLHYSFIKKANLSFVTKVDEEYLLENDILLPNRTGIPMFLIPQFKKAIPKIVKTLPNRKFWNEDNAIEWQMFGALLLDNRIKMSSKIKKKVIEATEYLMGEHADEFNSPIKRRNVLRKFIEKIKKL
jgi:hypothetical protein